MTVAESTAETGMLALAEAAVRAGKTRIVGVGGDGTHHDVLNGIVAAGGLTKVIYAPLPMGTGNDWVRTLGTPKRLDEWLKMLGRGKVILHQIGVLGHNSESRYDEDTPVGLRGRSISATTYFLNVAGLAYDAEVVRRSKTARYKHRFLYPLFTLFYLKDFDAPTVRINYDGKAFTGRVHTINLGIGRYSGGGMRLVPHAEPTADTLALTFARRLPIWKILLESWRFYTGTVGRVSGVTTSHVKSVRITSLDGRLELEADGEWLWRGGVEVGLLGERLRVVV